MKIAVTTVGPSLDEQVEARFGRTPYYVFVDTDTMKFEAVQNPNVSAGGGAGIQSAQLMSDQVSSMFSREIADRMHSRFSRQQVSRSLSE